ncbi:hypothetical protein GCM10025786_28510 [Nocardioides caeni]
MGGAWFAGIGPDGGHLPVPLLISTFDVDAQEGFTVCGEGVGPAHIRVVDGIPVTSPAWSVSFAMRYAETLREAVIALDMAAYSDLVSLTEVAAIIGHQSSWTGVPQAREALALGDENSWSPRETAMRLTWQLGVEGARPRSNLPLFDRGGRHIGTPDLIDVAAGVAADYDGVTHLGREQRRADRSRDELFVAHGIEMVRWLSGDRPGDFLARLHLAYESAGRRTGERSWVADPPPRWTSTVTVATRRALSDHQRSRFLRYRIG